jgi:hypothetical protein
MIASLGCRGQHNGAAGLVAPYYAICAQNFLGNRRQSGTLIEQTVEESVMASDASNPKRQPDPQSNTEKPVEEWVTGDEPMTGAQASYLKTLCEEAGEAFDPDLTKAEASKRIDALQAKTGRGASQDRARKS